MPVIHIRKEIKVLLDESKEYPKESYCDTVQRLLEIVFTPQELKDKIEIHNIKQQQAKGYNPLFAQEYKAEFKETAAQGHSSNKKESNALQQEAQLDKTEFKEPIILDSKIQLNQIPEVEVRITNALGYPVVDSTTEEETDLEIGKELNPKIDEEIESEVDELIQEAEKNA